MATLMTGYEVFEKRKDLEKELMRLLKSIIF